METPSHYPQPSDRLPRRRSSPSVLSSRSSHRSYSIFSSSLEDGSTVPGIGVISGRAIKAFGNAELWLLDNVSIRRKLSYIDSYFPHDCLEKDDEMDEIYAYLLDVLTFSDHTKRVKKLVTATIVRQIQHGKIQPLLNSLYKSSAHDICIFIPLIMSWYTWSHGITFANFVQGWGTMANNMLVFLCQLADSFDFVFPILLEEGFLDMILCVCIGEKAQTTSCSSSNSFTVYNHALMYHSRDPDIKDRISRHALSDLWPSHIPFFMRDPNVSAHRPNTRRWRAWREVKAHIIEYRIHTVSHLSTKYCSVSPGFIVPPSSSQLSDMVLDALEFSKKEIYGQVVADMALYILIQLISKIPNVYQVYIICKKALEIMGEPVMSGDPGPESVPKEGFCLGRPGIIRCMISNFR